MFWFKNRVEYHIRVFCGCYSFFLSIHFISVEFSASVLLSINYLWLFLVSFYHFIFLSLCACFSASISIVIIIIICRVFIRCLRECTSIAALQRIQFFLSCVFLCLCVFIIQVWIYVCIHIYTQTCCSSYPLIHLVVLLFATTNDICLSVYVNFLYNSCMFIIWRQLFNFSLLILLLVFIFIIIVIGLFVCLSIICVCIRQLYCFVCILWSRV